MNTLFAAGEVDCVYPRPVVAQNSIEDLPETFQFMKGSLGCCFDGDRYVEVQIGNFSRNDHNFSISGCAGRVTLSVTPRYLSNVVYSHTETSLKGMMEWLSHNTRATVELEVTTDTDKIDFISKRDGSIFYKKETKKYQILAGN